MRTPVFLLLGILYFGQISGIIGQDLSALVVDVSSMGDGSISQARLEAQRQARSGGLPFRSFTRGEIRTFVGQYTPPELPEDKKDRFIYGLALFSDDGCNLTLKGSSVHARFGRGQHLPNLGESFHVLPVALAPGETVDITIDYRNTIYAVLPGQPPDIDGLTLFLYLIPVAIAVDANRDGDIVFEGDSKDTTSSDKPFRFWINDDDDGRPNEEAEIVPAVDEDHADGTMQTMRDLEDFARIHLRLDGLHEQLADGTFKVGLKFSQVAGGSSKIKVYKSADPDGSNSYLTDEKAATAQISGTHAQSLGDVTSGDPLMLPTDFWVDSSEQSVTKYLLFEGCNEGKGKLILTIHQSDGTQIAEAGTVWLDVKNVKKMYYRGTAQPENIPAPNGNVVGPFTGPMWWAEDPNRHSFPAEKPQNENDSSVIFVHGWSMNYPDYISFSETMFKRLWQMGFNGRFCTLRWDPLVVGQTGVVNVSNGEYNRSEHRAWLYGESLKQFAESIKGKGFKVSIIGHSMGNIVCGSALEKGLGVQNYILMEAAIPAGCFDVSSEINSYGRFTAAEASEPTPDYHLAPNGEETRGYRGFLSSIHGNVASRVVNYHNSDDYALATGYYFGLEANWEKNQVDYKPDGNLLTDWHYHYDSTQADVVKRATQQFTFFTGRFVTDSYEMKAFVARPRSKAAGAVEGTLENPSLNGMVNVNLRTTYQFGRENSDHSGQFNRRIQQVDDLYQHILNIVQPPPLQ